MPQRLGSWPNPRAKVLQGLLPLLPTQAPWGSESDRNSSESEKSGRKGSIGSSVDMQGSVINYLVVILIELRQWATLWLFECVQQLLDLCRHFPSTEMWELSVRKLRWGKEIFSSYNHHHHQKHPQVHHHHHRCDRHLVVPCDDSLSERCATCPYLP